MSAQFPTDVQLKALEATWLGREVRVSDRVPPLRRFAEQKGIVRAVNKNGRCLVAFGDSPDAGWYDVEPQHLVLAMEDTAPPATSEPADD